MDAAYLLSLEQLVIAADYICSLRSSELLCHVHTTLTL